MRLSVLAIGMVLQLQIPFFLYTPHWFLTRNELDQVEPDFTTTFDGVVSQHIVVAHCKEDLAWLDQLQNYDPLFCQRCHIHIYSKCGAHVDLEGTIPAVAKCATLHRAMNFGVEEYAYISYIQDMYDSLPPMISFIQGGALTENPHVIYDILGPNLPGLMYRGLARHVRGAWHMIEYEKVENKGEVEFISRFVDYLFNESLWLTDWRGMLTVSRAQIRQHPWKAYSFINEKTVHEECHSVSCNMEFLFAPFLAVIPMYLKAIHHARREFMLISL
jgi:hypothetical protein